MTVSSNCNFSDSGLEKNYHTMSGDDDDTMEETVDEDGGGMERVCD